MLWEVNALPTRTIRRRDWPKYKGDGYYIVNCGYKYTKPTRMENGNVKWVCVMYKTRKCKGWIEQITPPNLYTYVEVKEQHNHPIYPDNLQLFYPYPYKPGKDDLSYEDLKAVCCCHQGKNPYPERPHRLKTDAEEEADLDLGWPPHCEELANEIHEKHREGMPGRDDY